MKTSLEQLRLSKTSCSGRLAIPIWAIAVLALAIAASGANAQTEIFKTNNTDALNLGSSWVNGVVPTSSEVAVWSNNVVGANSTVLGTNNLSFGGIKIVNPGGAVTIGTNASGTSFSLGSYGIDMSAATQNLTISGLVTLTSNQTFNVTNSRTLTFASGSSLLGGVALTKSGGGNLTLGVNNGNSNNFSKVILNGGTLTGGNGANTFGTNSSIDLINGTLAFNVNQTINAFYTNNALNVLGNVTISNKTSSSATYDYFQFKSLNIGGNILTVTAYDGGGYTNSGTITIAGLTTLTNNSVFNIATRANNSMTLMGGVSDAGNGYTLTKDGVGLLRIVSNSAYLGDTLIKGGVLEVQNVTGGQTVNIVVTNANRAQIVLTNGSTTDGLVVGQSLSGLPGAVILSIDSTNAFTVNRQVNTGSSNSLTFGSTSGSLSNSTLDYNNYGGTVSFGYSTNITLGGIKGAQNLGLANNSNNAVALTVGGNNQSTVYSGAMSGAGALIKTGVGTLTFSGSNSYTGATVVNNGALQLGDGGTGGALSASSTISISNGARLIFNRNNDVAQGTDFSGGAIGGAGGIVKSGAGTLTLNGGNTYSGGTTINSGFIVVSAADSMGASTGSLTFAGASTLRLGGSFSSDRNYVLNAQGTIDTAGNTLTHSGVISGASGLVKVGNGTLTLSGNNSYGGGTAVNAGVLALSGSGKLGSTNGAVSIGGGTLDLGGNNSVTNASLTITSGALNNGKLTAATYALNGGTVSANLGAGILNVGGIATLNGTADAAAVNINSGTLTLGSADRLNTAANVNVTGVLNLGANNQTVAGLTGVGVVTNSTGSTLTVTKSLGSTESFSGAIRGAGGFIKNGAGTFTLTGSSNKISTATVSGGLLVVNGALDSATTVSSGGTLGGTGSITSVTVGNGGTLSPGNSPGLMTVTETFKLENGSAIKFELANFTGDRGIGWDAIEAYTLDINSLSGSNAVTINIASFDGGFNNWNFSASTNNYSFALIRQTSGEGITGFNANLFQISTSSFTQPTGANDYSWSISLGTSTVANDTIYLNYTAVPEPSTYALIVLTGVGFAAHVIRRRHRRGGH